jgi:tRNA (cmo5U34)-methyltransferase
MGVKSTLEQIRQRFDNDVGRFSNLETVQSATIDAPLAMELITQAAAAVTPHAHRVLDIGCGAGNFTLKLLQALPDLNVTLLDLSRPVLERAGERVHPATCGSVTTEQGDIRDDPLGSQRFDVIIAAAVFHHLRTDAEWCSVFRKCYEALQPGGSLWISDLVAHERSEVHARMWTRYGEYLSSLKGDAYCDHVFAYIEQEDTPRSLVFQLDMLREVGFASVEVLHKNGPFAAFGAIK